MTPNPDYVARVNRAIDFILAHLDEPIRLDDVAAVAHFSACHFHRVFRALVGETLGQFIKRVRLERALTLTANRPELSLTEIALDCGFSSSSDFSRSFKQHFGVPPSAFEIDALQKSRRKELQNTLPQDRRYLLERLEPGSNPDGFEVTLRQLPEQHVAYIRVHKPYEGGVAEAAARLVDWARARGFADGQWLGYQWENPSIVALDDCRYDVGVTLESRIRPDGEVGCTTFPPMQVAELDIVGAIDLEMRALDWMFDTWLPSSGYYPANQPAFEAWNGLPFAHGFERFDLRMWMPVVRD